MSLPTGLTDFQGAWRIDRQIDDQLTGQTIIGQGQADWVPVNGDLQYNELLHLTVPGQRPIKAERRYLWSGTGGIIDIAFADGRPFHKLTLGDVVAADTHLCDPDQYEVLYDFGAWPIWSSRWTVRGPRKSYVMHTQYHPDRDRAGQGQ